MYEQTYDDQVYDQRREARSARAQYLGAVSRLNRAMNTFFDHPVELEPRHDSTLTPWTKEQAQLMIECSQAWADLVDKRRHLDRVLRGVGGPSAHG